MPGVSEETLKKINLLSDQELYREAVTLARKYRPVDAAQVHGLLGRLHSWAEITSFVKHQKEDRTWSGSKKDYKNFYTDLHTILQNFPSLCRTEFAPVPEGLTNKQEKEMLNEYSLLLAREFMQHLAAELAMRRIEK